MNLRPVPTRSIWHTCPPGKNIAEQVAFSILCRALEFRSTAGEQPEIVSSLPAFAISLNGILNEEECRRFMKFQHSLRPLDITMGDLHHWTFLGCGYYYGLAWNRETK
eukprot:Gregarina_sp_Poly_1__6659@NODE_3585_length_992_cov_9_302703_g2279_i0_p1_GENE_NODE_3585_length_992_cov_9_302703_g2279_i0NODE_3585_length_992_cov_9_302703_g2279_i0_p1_ORF_typecomplete_len108_score9_41_NODE_3585_length_992_cov_9_302703_g2279_i0663986